MREQDAPIVRPCARTNPVSSVNEMANVRGGMANVRGGMANVRGGRERPRRVFLKVILV